MLMGVHPVGFLEDWVFGDFQSLKSNPDEHRIQPIEASHRYYTQQLVQPWTGGGVLQGPLAALERLDGTK